MKFVTGVAAIAVFWALIVFIIVITGAYNVAATIPDSDVARRVLHSTMRRSVQVRATSEFQENWTERQISEGFRDFDAMCVVCHSAPGEQRSSISKGMNPQPPLLAEAVKQWRSSELFWIIKNGVRMTGMPAFGLAHRDDEIWEIVGFVRQLPQISAEDYRKLREKLSSSLEEHHYH
jgi:cytochrome c